MTIKKSTIFQAEEGLSVHLHLSDKVADLMLWKRFEAFVPQIERFFLDLHRVCKPDGVKSLYLEDIFCTFSNHDSWAVSSMSERGDAYLEVRIPADLGIEVNGELRFAILNLMEKCFEGCTFTLDHRITLYQEMIGQVMFRVKNQ